ncbi:hypothetical protein DPMN_172955 [Dreissena polymorpha]|uniref:Uncharacterized protein n=1 Tax=Dreissena polymorpha TaxID=45954 RepID=A0A9D4E3T0_DREPO|nr:hypothetical protein DPMN_172955 [Dreissena polymorpha]
MVIGTLGTHGPHVRLPVATEQSLVLENVIFCQMSPRATNALEAPTRLWIAILGYVQLMVTGQTGHSGRLVA